MNEFFYTVTILFTDDAGSEPWVSTFSTEEKADAFVSRAMAMIAEFDLADTISVIRDSGYVDSEEYLDWLSDLKV